MLQGSTVGRIGVVRDAKQLLSLLLFEDTHRVLEHFAQEQALSLDLGPTRRSRDSSPSPDKLIMA
jgi:hypothetical protein